MTFEIKHHTPAAGTNAGNGEITKEVWNEALDATMATSRLLGRTTPSAGPVEELTAEQVRTLINVEDGATANTGDVTAASAFSNDSRVILSDGTGKGVKVSSITFASGIMTGITSFYASFIQGGQLSMPDTGADHAAIFQMGTNLSASRTYTLAMPDGSYTYTFPGASVTLAALNLEDQTLAGGARVTVKDLGNLSGQTITPDPGDRPHQKLTNNGAGTIAPGSNYGDYYLDVINASGAGAITTSGWTKVSGDSFDTTTTSKFRCGCSVTADMSTMQILKVA